MLLDPEIQQKLSIYSDLLIKWQARINLVSPQSLSDAQRRHFDDSLQLTPLIPQGVKLYDLGSGAGFPGAVLAVARPDLSVTLIESDGKKCAFLKTVSRETNCEYAVENLRIEAATELLPAPGYVTTRALAPLENLLSFIKPWLEKNRDLKAVFPKGESFESEIADAQKLRWTFDCDIRKSATDRYARILILSNLNHKA